MLRVPCCVIGTGGGQAFLFVGPNFRDNAIGDDNILIGADGVAPFEWEERGAWTSGIRFGGAPKQEAQRE